MEKVRFASSGVEAVNKDTIIIHYYFTFQDTSKRQFDKFLRTAVSTICRHTRDFSLLEALYTQCHSDVAATEDLQSLLIEIVSRLWPSTSICFLLDALDEIAVCEQDEMMSFLFALNDMQAPHLQILLTSRNEPAIRDAIDHMERWATVALTKEVINRDIELHVESSIATHYRLSKMAEETKELITSTLTKKANGM